MLYLFMILSAYMNIAKNKIYDLAIQEIQNGRVIRFSNMRNSEVYLYCELEFDKITFYKSMPDLDKTTYLSYVEINDHCCRSQSSFLEFLENAILQYAENFKKVIIVDMTDPARSISRKSSQNRAPPKPQRACELNGNTRQTAQRLKETTVEGKFDKDKAENSTVELKELPEETGLENLKFQFEDKNSSPQPSYTNIDEVNAHYVVIKPLKCQTTAENPHYIVPESFTDSKSREHSVHTQINHLKESTDAEHVDKDTNTGHIYETPKSKKQFLSSKRIYKHRISRLFPEDMKLCIENYLKESTQLFGTKLKHFLYIEEKALCFMRSRDTRKIFVYNQHDKPKCVVPFYNEENFYYLNFSLSRTIQKKDVTKTISKIGNRAFAQKFINKIDEWFTYELLMSGWISSIWANNSYMLPLLNWTIMKSEESLSRQDLKEHIFDTIFFIIKDSPIVQQILVDYLNKNQKDTNIIIMLKALGAIIKSDASEPQAKNHDRKITHVDLNNLNILINVILLHESPLITEADRNHLDKFYIMYKEFRKIVIEETIKGLNITLKDKLYDNEEFYDYHIMFFKRLADGPISNIVVNSIFGQILNSFKKEWNMLELFLYVEFYYRVPEKLLRDFKIENKAENLKDDVNGKKMTFTIDKVRYKFPFHFSLE